MTKNYCLAIGLAASLHGCDMNRTDDLGAQQRERAELSRDQQQERSRQATEQAAERVELRQEAQQEIVAQTADVRDERADLNEASRALAQTISLACGGVATPDECPLDDPMIQSSTDTEHGLVVHLRPDSGTPAQVRSRIECYRARVSVRPVQLGGKCIVDLTNAEVAVDVRQTGDHVVVDFASTDETVLGRIRAQVRGLVSRATPRRETSARN